MTSIYTGTILSSATLPDARRVIPDYEVMLLTILDAILDRFGRDPDYPFIDTKLDLITGQNFPTPSDDSTDFKGKTAIYGWIQGRGLESLVGHARWLASGHCSILTPAQRQTRLTRLNHMIQQVFHRMETIRQRNAGHLSFLMTPQGQPFERDSAGRRTPITDLPSRGYGFADLFYVKGMLAAAAYLGHRDKLQEAAEIFRTILTHIESDRFRSDAISFDPKNILRPQPGKFFHGPRMIAIGGCALFAETLGDQQWFTTAFRLIRHILDRHSNHGQSPSLQPHDYWEGADAAGRPWVEPDGSIINDPGHATEFVGLAARLLLLSRSSPASTSPEHQALINRCTIDLPAILRRNFHNGYNPAIGGICKTFDLSARRPLNSDMPWWNLPETMRAAAEMLLFAPADQHQSMLEIFTHCSNGFLSRFVDPQIHLMARQTIDAHGQPVRVIPATPDADPGYHTGLSMIDAIACLKKASE